MKHAAILVLTLCALLLAAAPAEAGGRRHTHCARQHGHHARQERRCRPVSTTITVNVAAEADDGYWADSGFFDSALLPIAGTTGGDDAHIFVRFLTSIPNNAHVESASLTVYGTVVTGTPLLKLYGEAADSPAAVTSAANGAARVLTTASVDWDGIGADTQVSPDLTAILQEIVTRPGFAGTLQLFIKDDNAGAGDHFVTINNFALGPITGPALLTVTYIAPDNHGSGRHDIKRATTGAIAASSYGGIKRSSYGGVR